MGDPDFETTAAVAQRLAVLMDAGLAPTSAWRHVASTTPSPLVTAVVARGGVGRELALHVLAERTLAPPGERPAWAALAAAWWVAVESGAPLAPTLHRLAVTLRALSQSLREVRVALAGPLATSRIVLALPAIGLLFGVALGFDAPRVLVTTPQGWACLAAGASLVVVGIRWNGRLVRQARRLDPVAGLGLELLAIAVSGGASLERSRRLVDHVLGDAELPPLGPEVDDVLAFSARAGVPAAGLLLAESAERRREAQASAQLQAARLGARLLLPLGVCILPAFIALGVVPVAIAILGSTVAQL